MIPDLGWARRLRLALTQTRALYFRSFPLKGGVLTLCSMNTPLRLLLPRRRIALLLALVLASCSGPQLEILNRPVTATKNDRALRDSKNQADGTLATLRTENLLQTYREHPQQAIVTLAQRHQQAPTAARRQALGEMLSDTGDELLADNRAQALGYYLDGARLCEKGALQAVSSNPNSPDRTIYNYCAGRVARILREGAPQGNSTLTAPGALHTFQLGIAQGKGHIHPASLDLLVPSSWMDITYLKVPRIAQTGFGLAMVGHQDGTPERIAAAPLMTGAGFSLALNATLRFSGGRATLVLTDSMMRSKDTISGHSVPLAADYTVPIGFTYGQRRIGLTKILGTLRPAKFEDTIGLLAIEPYRKDKIPLILVHGILSSAESWMPFANLLRADPVLRERYQLIFFNYPTGNTLSRNSGELREALSQFQKTYDPHRNNPAMRKMVILGHSMGGILSNMQIRTSQGEVEAQLFDKPLTDIDIDKAERHSIKSKLRFDANPDITRAIFIATPHRGSAFAANPIGQFGAWLIRLPFDLVDTLVGDITVIDAMTDVAQEASQRPRNSVTSLRPDNPILPIILSLPTNDGFPIHSIIAQRNPEIPKLEGTDGVVPYTSAHLDNAQSEVVVLNTSHRVVPETEESINEVLRILYKHLGMTRKDPSK
jgi:hypothetical protein